MSPPLTFSGVLRDVAARGASAARDAVVAARDSFAASFAKRTPQAEGKLAIPPPWQERDPAILGNRLTPVVMAGIIRRRNEGHFQPWIDQGAEFLGKNPHLVTQLGIRRMSVAETRFEIRPGKGSNQQRARMAAKDFQELIERWKHRQQWEPILGQIVAAEWWGRSLHELLWSSEEAGFTVPEHAVWVHTRRLSLAAPIGDPDAWVMRLHDPDDSTSPFYGAYGVPLTKYHPDKFILHETQPLGVHRTGEGLFAAAVWFLLMYEWDWRDLMALVELLGRPGHVGYYAASSARAAQLGSAAARVKFDGGRDATPEEVAALEAAVTRVSGSLRTVLPDTTRIEPLEYGQRNTPLQREVALHIEGLLSKLVNGSTGVTDIVAGARAAHEVAYAQSYTPWRYDVRRVCGWFNDLGRRMVAANPDRYRGCPPPEMFSPDIERPATTTPPENKGDGEDGSTP